MWAFHDFSLWASETIAGLRATGDGHARATDIDAQDPVEVVEFCIEITAHSQHLDRGAARFGGRPPAYETLAQ